MNKRQHPIIKRVALCALALLALLSFFPGGASAEAKPGVPVTRVSLGSIAKMNLMAGQTKWLKATVYPYEATKRGVVWRSSNESVVTVDSGAVTGVSKGKAVITVKTVDGGHTDSIKVTVKEPPKGIRFGWTYARICPGDTIALDVFLNLPARASTVWSSNNENAATVENGVVTARSPGTAYISLSAPGTKYRASCEIEVVTTEISSDYYKIDRQKGEITGVAKSTFAGQLRANLNNSGGALAVYNANGSVYRGKRVATGMSVRLNVYSKTRDELKVVVSGDCDGDGEITAMDYTLARLHALGVTVLKDEYFTAGDVNGDGEITAADYTLIKLDASGVKPLLSGIPELPKVKNKHIKALINAAFALRGRPYLWGAEGPANYDCSGFVYTCLRKAGCGTGRTTARVYARRKSWKYVPKNKLRPGDLMFFRDEDNQHRIGHIGIYLGNGYMIHASSQYGGVVVSAVRGSYAKTLSHGRRVWR